MEAAMGQKITKKDLQFIAELLNLDKELTPEKKSSYLIRNCDMELGKLIIEKKIKKWEDISALYPTKSTASDEVLKICLENKVYSETRDEFIDRIATKLEDLGCSENLIIKHLATKLWPGNDFRALELSGNTSLDELKVHCNLISNNNMSKKVNRKSKRKEESFKENKNERS
ncbi:uncharacterized protein VNE69_08056 [Vairimorpha necatrix]|uniref:Uncharacterized protein n=1 Tax=Vairimorpha necatrix TaxID=6039 RepID=A0AAX4JED9_9MICR